MRDPMDWVCIIPFKPKGIVQGPQVSLLFLFLSLFR